MTVLHPKINLSAIRMKYIYFIVKLFISLYPCASSYLNFPCNLRQHFPLKTHSAWVCCDGTPIRLTSVYIYIVYLFNFFLKKAQIPASGDVLLETFSEAISQIRNFHTPILIFFNFHRVSSVLSSFVFPLFLL